MGLVVSVRLSFCRCEMSLLFFLFMMKLLNVVGGGVLRLSVS